MSARRRLWTGAALASLVLVAVSYGLLAGAGDDGKAARRAVYRNELPAGPGRELAERSCLVCHGAMLVTQQAKDSTGWEKTLAQMEKWGVGLTPAEHDTLRDYLLASFGPRPAK